MSLRHDRSRAHIVYIGDNNGAGKTTLTNLLGNALRCSTLASGAARSPYRFDIHHHPSRFAFEAQVAFLARKALMIVEWRRTHTGLLVVDRSPFEDARVFAKYWHERGD